jgi:glutathione S-transferase
MLTLYSYPGLFGVADNNGYGLKVYAFLKLTGVPFTHEHVIDASKAPRGQLPYIVDDGVTVGDSETILAHLIEKYHLTIDAPLTPAQRTTDHLITRLLECRIRAGRTIASSRRSAMPSWRSMRRSTNPG